MKIIYLDRNIHEHMLHGDEIGERLKKTIKTLKNKGAQFPISAMHIEEAASLFVTDEAKKETQEYISSEKDLFLDLSDGNVILPNDDTGRLEIWPDNIFARFDLVLENIDESKAAFANELSKQLPYRSQVFREKHNITDGEFSSISPNDIWKIKKVCDLFNQYTDENPIDYTNGIISEIMSRVETMYDFFDIIGFARTKKMGTLKKMRARMYDTGHILYALAADTLVTADLDLHKKATAIYSSLHKKINIMTSTEFVNMP